MDLFKHLHAKIGVLLAGASLWCSQAMVAYAEVVTIDGLIYGLERGYHLAWVEGYTEGITEVDIPSVITSEEVEYSVIEIAESVFKGCSSLQSVTIPNSITTIGRWAFNGCSSLQSVTIPNGVTTIKYATFQGCSSLRSVTIPDNVTTIDDAAFDGCSNLQDIKLPESVTTIGRNVFSRCSSLQSITIPDNVTTIGGNAFKSCTSLQNVSIPNSVTTIGDSAFYGCAKLNNITFTSEVLTLKGNVFYGVVATAYVPAASAPIYKALEWGGDIAIEYLNEYKRSTQVGDFGTICLPYDYTPEGATLYNIESIEDNKVILTTVEGNQGLANTAYIYQATEDEQNFSYVTGESLNTELVNVTTGALTSPAEYGVVPEDSYVLQTLGGVQAFYKVDSEIYIKPHRAYLTLDSNSAAPSLHFTFGEGNLTGLEAIRTVTQATPAIYDLNGRRLSSLQNDLNIVGGVKVFVK
jgi:hypothetical protein